MKLLTIDDCKIFPSCAAKNTLKILLHRFFPPGKDSKKSFWTDESIVRIFHSTKNSLLSCVVFRRMREISNGKSSNSQTPGSCNARRSTNLQLKWIGCYDNKSWQIIITNSEYIYSTLPLAFDRTYLHIHFSNLKSKQQCLWRIITPSSWDNKNKFLLKVLSIGKVIG